MKIDTCSLACCLSLRTKDKIVCLSPKLIASAKGLHPDKFLTLTGAP